jgi:energy-coupling factor transport system permease protein
MNEKQVPPKIDALAWVIWVAAFAAISMSTRNPIYSIAIILIARLVGTACGIANSPTSGLPIARIGIAIVLFSILFNGLSVHVGETVLFTLPERLPWIGGRITLEATVYGLGTGLLLLSLLAVFVAFNSVVRSSDLVRLAPGAFRDLGVVILIAVTYVPETKLQLQRIREAQSIRGHRLRGIRSWRPIVIPLLVGGLERAMGLAEAMVARGYGATSDIGQPLRIQLALAGGLLFALAGWVLTFWIPWMGWTLLGIGLLTVSILLQRLGKRTPRSKYQERRWTYAESAVLGGAAFALIVTFVPLPFVDRSTYLFSPYPTLGMPGVDPLGAVALAALMIPAFVGRLQRAHHDDQN